MATTGHKLLAAGTAALIAEPVLALAHTGGIGVIVGLVVGAIAYNAVEDVEHMAGREDASSLPGSQETGAEQQTAQVAEKRPSLAYRIFNGKSTRNAVTANEDESSNTKKQETPLSEDREVDLADDLRIDIDELAGKATFIVGMRRSGKTTLGARVAEQMGRFHIPMFIPDLEGDYLSLSAPGMLPRCVVAGHPDAYNSQANYMYAPIRTINDAQLLGYKILDDGLQVILNMASYDTIEEACLISVNIIKGIFAWTKRNPTELCPCEIYLDEAQRFLPENLSESIIQDDAILKAMLKTYMDIIAVGGKRGLTPKILSQRFAQTNKKIMAQAEVLFIMRQTNDNDLTRCMEYVKKSTATKEQIAVFEQGQGVYLGADGTQLVTRFKPRISDGSRSHTPKASAAMRYRYKKLYTVNPTTPSPYTPESQERNAVVAPLPILVEKENRPMANEIDLAEAIEAYNSGNNTRRKLADYFGMAENQGNNLLKRIEAARTAV